MTVQEEKKWLRAILEGRVTPKDKEWTRVAKDAEFARIRRILKHAEQLKLDDRSEDLKEIWQEVERHRDRGVNRRRIGGWHWAAAVATILLAVAGGWFIVKYTPTPLPVAERMETSGITKKQVTLTMASGEQVDLSALAGDTVFRQGDAHVRLNVAEGLAYEGGTQTTDKIEYNQVDVPRQCEYRIVLADGTKVHLNAASELRYPVTFARSERRVFLKGEAYFEVSRDAKCPFIVETADQQIRVLGTTFNVYAYPGETMQYTTLVEGKVVVQDKKTGADEVLVPGQQVALNSVTGVATVQDADLQQVLGWRSQNLIVREETLELLMTKVARWYDVGVVFEQEELKGMRFTANLHKRENLQELLDVISIIGNLDITLQNDVVTLGRR